MHLLLRALCKCHVHVVVGTYGKLLDSQKIRSATWWTHKSSAKVWRWTMDGAGDTASHPLSYPAGAGSSWFVKFNYGKVLSGSMYITKWKFRFKLIYLALSKIFFIFSLSTGEVERLLKEHQQNQELVEKIGRNSYQIIYPVQLRHHEKMGISTREVGAPKVRYRSRASSYSPSQPSSSSMNSITTFHHHNYNYNKNVTRTRKSYYPDDATMSTDDLSRMVCAFDFCPVYLSTFFCVICSTRFTELFWLRFYVLTTGLVPCTMMLNFVILTGPSAPIVVTRWKR